MSRRSTRTSSLLPGTSSDAVENEGKRLRSKVSSAATSIPPSRKSERTKTSGSAPLYNLADSSEDSPSPPKIPRTTGKPKNEVVRTASIKFHKAAIQKPEDVSNTPDRNETSGREPTTRTARGEKVQTPKEAEENHARRSSRAPKPINRYVDEVKNSLSNSEITAEVTTPTAADGTNDVGRKSTRARKGESSVDTPSLAKVTKRKEVEAVTIVDTPETPRPSRKAALQKHTPKDTPVKSKSAATTSIVSKDKEVKPASAVAPETKLEWKFNVYGIPKCPLPCREEQFEEIWKFLFENVTERNSGCMYVSGVPGTGKTVIVQAVVNTMQKISDIGKKALQFKFKYLYINGLTLSSHDKIWKRMFKGLSLQSKSHGISGKEALKRLDHYFESHERDPVILVVDELDHILDRQQSILYHLLEWSSHSKNMFSFVAIFNTQSLPENGLATRNCSRMGFKRAVFPPYSYDQLQTIVSNMLATFKTSKLSTESVTLLSRKVAAISGDARRALEIARRALEIAESDSLSGIQAVSNAFKEIFSSAKIETIKYTSLLEQLILKSICEEIRCSGVEEVLTAKIYENVAAKAAYEGLQWPKDEVLKALMRLALMHLVIVEDNFPSLHKRILLKVPVEDVNFALGIQDLDN